MLKRMIQGWHIAISTDLEFLNLLMYVLAPVITICFSIIIFLELNKELWK